MNLSKTYIKKLTAKAAIISTLGVLATTPVLAAGAESKDNGSITTLLKYIANYTYYTLQAVNNLPAYLNTMTTLALSWLSPDNSDTTANLQFDLVTLNNQVMQNSMTQNKLQKQLSTEFLGNINTKTMPYANDLTYQTVLGDPYFPEDPRKNAKQANQQMENVDPVYNYIKNAAGINLTHERPDNRWKGTENNKKKYMNFYQAISAVQSYDGYILSRLYADYAKESQLTPLQQKLSQDACSSDWFTQVASENLGIVLRQILMYNSQIYVTLTQLVDLEKQHLAAQAMTNTLIVLGNEYNEGVLLTNAIGR